MGRTRKVLTDAGEVCVVALVMFGFGAAVILLGTALNVSP